MSVSFDRNISASEGIDGTVMSTKGMQLMTSTGVQSIDALIGNGFAINSITLLEEDNCSQYSSMITKCFVSEGIDCKHKTIISSQSISSKRSRLLRELPVRSTQALRPKYSQTDDIQIAWRYKSQPLVANSALNSESHYDFGSHISEQTLTSADIEFCSHNSCLDLIRSLKPNNKTITRILIDGLGSPLSPLSVQSLPQFVYKLKSLVRKLPNVLCLMTFNAQLVLLSNSSYVRSRVHNIVDAVIQLIGFDEWTQTPYKEYNGLFNVIKLSKLNSFNYYTTPETLDTGFQLTNNNKFFIVDKLCLPPDLSDTASRTTGCATSAGDKKFEF